MAGSGKSTRRWPVRVWFGLGLVAVFWTLSWSLSGTRTHWCFFPLWVGYCLVVDAWTWRRAGTSLWARSHAKYVRLFVASIPAWWLFELINMRTGNWHYLGRSEFGDLEYFLFASLSFSTVIPAVFGTSELVRSLGWVDRMPRRRAFRHSGGALPVMAGGLVALFLCLALPLYFFPLVWLSVFLILDPLNETRGSPSILAFLRVGEWRPLASLGIGCLICGFFWEMWNFYSYPKWAYEIPFVDFLRVFEMPVLGYAGYFPFSLELFALYHFIAGLGGQRESFLRLGARSAR